MFTSKCLVDLTFAQWPPSLMPLSVYFKSQRPYRLDWVSDRIKAQLDYLLWKLNGPKSWSYPSIPSKFKLNLFHAKSDWNERCFLSSKEVETNEERKGFFSFLFNFLSIKTFAILWNTPSELNNFQHPRSC